MQITYVYKVLLLCSLLFLLAAYDTMHAHILTTAVNNWVLQYIYVSPNTNHPAGYFYYETLLDLTALGSDVICGALLLVIVVDLIRRQEYKVLGYCLAATFLMIGVTELCKQLIFSPRPLFPAEHDSFPSGHTMRALIWCGILLLLHQVKVYSLSGIWRIMLLAVPLGVGFSRLGLGRHWLSDIVASYALGIGVWVFTVNLIYSKLPQTPARVNTIDSRR